MNTNNAFKLAANRVETYLAEVGVEINPKQAVAVICQYAGHGPWAALDFKKAARTVEKQLEALGVGQLNHTHALELVARIEGVKSWNVLTKHLAPDTESGMYEGVNPVGGPEGPTPPDSGADSLPLMWVCEDRPLSEAELQAHTDNGERYVKVVLAVNWDLLGDIEGLNDEVSERITGSSCDLEDIGYQNHFPTDKERQQFGEPDPRTVWIEVNAGWSPCD
jgi:hypothetical protein